MLMIIRSGDQNPTIKYEGASKNIKFSSILCEYLIIKEFDTM